jgi:hypothetical protein
VSLRRRIPSHSSPRAHAARSWEFAHPAMRLVGSTVERIAAPTDFAPVTGASA